MIDFTSCTIDPFQGYGGSNGGKICIIYEGERYMLKFPPTAPNVADMSYRNSSISEYISCHIYEMLGIETQKTLLGFYQVNNKEKLVVACKDFTDYDTRLMAFGELKNTCIDSSEGGYGTDLSAIIETIEDQRIMDPIEISERFWEMFVIDAFLGNFDRHNGNWGFLVNPKAQTARLAPVFDCGSCLYPQLSEEKMQDIMGSKEEIDKRVFVFPTSAVKLNGKKVNYADFIGRGDNPDCNAALKRIYPRIDMGKISSFIRGIDSNAASPVQKEFYCKMLQERKDKILMPGIVRMQVQGVEAVRSPECGEPEL